MSDTKPTNPKDRAASSRLDMTLFPDTAVAYGALAMTEGHLKYGGYNYRSAGVQASVYYAALQRHMAKWFNGEEEDPKTGVPHLANAIACVGVLIDAYVKGVLNDDRPPTCDMGALLNDFEAKVKALQEKFPIGPPRHTEKTERQVTAHSPAFAAPYGITNELQHAGPMTIDVPGDPVPALKVVQQPIGWAALAEKAGDALFRVDWSSDHDYFAAAHEKLQLLSGTNCLRGEGTHFDSLVRVISAIEAADYFENQIYWREVVDRLKAL